MRKILGLLILVATSAAEAKLSLVSVNFDQNIDSPRWMFDAKTKVSSGALVQNLVKAKKSLLANDRSACLSALAKAYSLGKSLGPWISWNQLQCAQLPDKAGVFSVRALSMAIEKVQSQPQWLLSGPHAQLLQGAYVSALQVLAEQQSKVNRPQAWKTLDRLQQHKGWLKTEERAKIYRLAGELSFIEQNLPAAQDFFLRSISEKDNPELRAKVDLIRATLLGRKKEPLVTKATSETQPASVPVREDLGVSEEEREIYVRMNRALETQDYISSVEDAIALIKKFPGGQRASEASDRVLDIYLSVVGKGEDKFLVVRERIVKEMANADAARLSRWANNAYARGSYLDALDLAEKAYAKFDGHPDSTKMALLAGEAAQAAGEYETARKNFEKLVLKHTGTKEAAEATFRLGLIEFRNRRYNDAAAFFERVLALRQGVSWEYRALYWQWRSRQKIDEPKSREYAQPLIEKFPLSYYGLRAQLELNGGEMQLSTKKIPAKLEMRLLQTEHLAWERLNILLKAGWFREAEEELQMLPQPTSNEERVLHAKLWAASLRYDLAIQILNKVFEENPSFVNARILKIVFPLEYSSSIVRESKANGLHADWVRSLIRQESSFRPAAKSTANALGLMQLLPSTAQELARDFKIKDFSPGESLLNPEINIRLGSAYLSRMIRSFGGNMPLALAAYNAGPTRLRRWLMARKDLSSLEMSASSAPEVEVWIDEMPWEETSFYVKAILRNWLIYRLLDGSKLSQTEPIWVDAKSTAR